MPDYFNDNYWNQKNFNSIQSFVQNGKLFNKNKVYDKLKENGPNILKVELLKFIKTVYFKGPKKVDSEFLY